MRLRRTALLALGVLALALGAAVSGAEEGRPFTATWTLSGHRTALPTEGARSATIVYASGSFVITRGDTLGRGFFGEVIGFDDGGTVIIGRAVFTDERGDKIFATLKAQPLGTGRSATGTITGGTGRWSGLEGEFTFSWKFVVEAGADEFQAMAVNVEGRARRTPPKAPAPEPPR